MDPSVWAAFAAATIVVLIIPGPTALLVVAYSLKEGPRAGMAVTAGVAAGDFVAMTASLLGLGALLSASATAFTILKLIGAAYLIYLGIKMLRAPAKALTATEERHLPRISAADMGWRAFAVTVTNPKSILFFVAFVPQFIDPAAPTGPQFAVMIATFVGLATANAAAYAYLAGSLSRYVADPRNMAWVNRIGGGTLVGLGAVAATAQRSG